MKGLVVALGFAALTVGAGISQASHTCVYVNDTVWDGAPNTVDGYSVSADLSTVYISPVPTGGTSYAGANFQHIAPNIVP